MPESRYINAWCFDATILSVYQAASAWEAIRLFRLVRLRHETMYRETGVASLASLPAEILAMVEADILEYELQDALDTMPKNECVCEDLWDKFIEDAATQRSMADYCDAQDVPFDGDEDDVNACLEDWQSSEEFEEAWANFSVSHANVCQGLRAATKFWCDRGDELLSGTHRRRDEDLSKDVLYGLTGTYFDEFLSAHGLMVYGASSSSSQRI